MGADACMGAKDEAAEGRSLKPMEHPGLRSHCTGHGSRNCPDPSCQQRGASSRRAARTSCPADGRQRCNVRGSLIVGTLLSPSLGYRKA